MPTRHRLPPLVVATVLTTALALASLASLLLGSKAVPVSDLVAAARGGGDPYTTAVLATRIPRTLCGLLAGAALAVGGAAVQVATRNPLGDPGVLGLTSGAAAGVVTASALGLAGLGSVGGAFVGALLATVAVLTLGHLGRDADATRLLLAGAVLIAVCLAWTQSVALRDRSAFESLRFWSAGSLAGGAQITSPILVTLGLGAVLITTCARGLDALMLGDVTAAALGHRPGLLRGTTFLAVALLTAAATAVTGPIAFVGLAVPHLARPLVGSSTRALFLASALLGPVLLLAADVTGRLVLSPSEVPVGVMTGLLGAPVLIGVVRRLRGNL